jgi:HEAT repeat protein
MSYLPYRQKDLPNVPLFCKRLVERVLVTVCLLAGLGSGGCGWLADGALRELPLPSGGPPEQAGQARQTVSTDPLRPPDVTAGDRKVLARSSDGHGRSVWIRAVQPLQEDPAGPEYRWRYPALEELLARPPGRHPNWYGYLADKDPIVPTNAAIALARAGDDRGLGQLARAVQTPDINQPMRCAAAEALGRLDGPSAVPLLRELLDQYGRCAASAGSTYHAELHAELIRALARHVDPADDPRFVAALHSRAANVRLEGLRAWAEGRGGELPNDAVDLRADPDPRVRAAAVQALARRRHPQAHRYLAAALRDNELTVRTAAIAALGEVGGSEARPALQTLLEDQPEAIRAAAVSALAQSGAEQVVLGAAGDRSWRVRLKVAQALAAYADHDAAAVARQLLEDPSPVVQREVVVALAEWPLQRAGPILLDALGSRSLVTRQAAAEKLSARWPPAKDFPIDAPPERQAEALKELRGRFQGQFNPGGGTPPAPGAGDRLAIPATAAGCQGSASRAPTEGWSGHRPATVSPRLLGRLELLVRQQDISALIDFGPGLVEGLEQLVFDRQQLLPEAIYREVLPRYAPAFAALDRLASADVLQRRDAAGKLAELARQRPLGRLAVARLAELAVAESDELVWQGVFSALADDASEPSIRLAYAAISHPSAEVRRRACEHLAAHPHPAHAKMLLPALEDQHEAVVCAAVRALGATGRLDDTEPLRWLLRTTSQDVRLETARALIRLGDPTGKAALERLAYSADPKVRYRAAVAMGETAESAFTPTLIRLLDDRPAVCRAALEGLPKVVGRDASASKEEQAPATTSERVRRWKQWFDGRRDVAPGGASG